MPSRIPRSVPDEEFNEIFAALHSHRDRALVAFYVSTGARASELLSATRGGADPGRQLITVVRKGTRELQQLPASTDAFVWLRLYQLEMDGKLPRGSGQPLWWTLRRPFRPLAYHAAHRMFERAGAAAGTDATLHSLRHTAAYRMAEDPALPLTDVQLVLGHALLTTTQLYLTPRKEDVIRRMLAHHAEQVRQARRRVRPAPAPGYRPESLDVLFGNGAVVTAGAGRAASGRRRCGWRVTGPRGPVSRPPDAGRRDWPASARGPRAGGRALARPAARASRRGLGALLDWLQGQEGGSWQQRWLASGSDAAGAAVAAAARRLAAGPRAALGPVTSALVSA